MGSMGGVRAMGPWEDGMIVPGWSDDEERELGDAVRGGQGREGEDVAWAGVVVSAALLLGGAVVLGLVISAVF